MQLVVLGSGTSVFHPQRASAAFWLETATGSILLDCSADAPHRMAQENLDWANLDAIWISHLHLDHCGGLASFLFGIRHAPQMQSRTKPLKILSCTGVQRLVQAMDDALDRRLLKLHFPIEFEEISPTQAGQTREVLPGLRATFFSTRHVRQSLAIRLTNERGRSVVYTSDTGLDEGVAKFAREAELLILDCSFYQNKPVQTHLNLPEAMRVAELSAPRRLLLTHLYPEWDEIDLEAAARKLWKGETNAAYDGLRLNIRD